jgi:hypothetical protein
MGGSAGPGPDNEDMTLFEFGRRPAWASALAIVLLQSACTPALDWRDVRPEGASIVLSLPCKPSVFARKVALAQGLVELSLHACSASGVTWALAHADVGDPTRVSAALRELRQSAASNLGAPLPPLTALLPPGATPNPESGRSVIQGRLPDGRQVGELVLVFARGTRVFQATAVGNLVPAEAAEVFASSIRLLP